MKTPKRNRRPRLIRAGVTYLALAAMVTAQMPVYAAATDIGQSPIVQNIGLSVKPNIMFVLDDSGSMTWTFTPDSLITESPGYAADFVGYRNHLCNKQYFDPGFAYPLPRQVDGTPEGTPFPVPDFTKAKPNGFDTSNASSTGIDLRDEFQAYDTSNCWYPSLGSSCSPSADTKQRAYYFKWKVANALPTEAECRQKLASYDSSKWEKKEVYGFTDEGKNFGIWFSYYRTRMLAMKSAASLAFGKLDDGYRVGLLTIKPNTSTGSVSSGRYTQIDDFKLPHRADWFKKMIAIEGAGGTPLREALSRVGRHYAGRVDGINQGMPEDPIQYSCQQNFALMVTDGQWNGAEGQTIAGTKMDPNKAQFNYDGDLGNALSPRPVYDGSYISTEVYNGKYTYVSTKFPGNSPYFLGSNCSGNDRAVVKVINETIIQRSVNTGAGVQVTVPGVQSTRYELYLDCQDNPTVPPTEQVSNATRELPYGPTGTLADVAQYYYMTDLRTETNAPTSTAIGSNGRLVYENNVPSSGNDNADWQHMVTFTLGMGVAGNLGYQDDYLTAATGDFADLKTGGKNWPNPKAQSQTLNFDIEANKARVDDLWHAAVNGRGQYFSAQNPEELVTKLDAALQAIKARKGAAAAAATSTLEPVSGDNFIYTASFRSLEWTGELQARQIILEGPDAGRVTGDDEACNPPSACWKAQQLLDARTSAASDTRTIYTFGPSQPTKLRDFKYDELTTAEKAFFGATAVANLTQAQSTYSAPMSASQKTAAAGANMVNFIRGQRGFEGYKQDDDTRLYRERVAILGDIVDAQPVYVRKPFANYSDTGYSDFRDITQASRVPHVYVAANDGMLHAFNATNGQESWAYVPTPMMPNLYRLADVDYANNHRYFVDGTPVAGDVYDSAAGTWKTILVGGYNGGGKGYYALDITNPASPRALWEFNWSSSCFPSTTTSDCNLGLSFGNPLISKIKDPTDATKERWVVMVTSGHNNLNGVANDGKGYLYVLDAVTGQILYKMGTGAGDATTPSGLTKITNFVINTGTNNYTERVYGVDLRGNVWRFDVNSDVARAAATAGNPAARRLATLVDDAGVGQPITTRPELGSFGSPEVPYVYVATGKFLAASDIPVTQQQTIYALRDSYAEPVSSLSEGAPINSNASTTELAKLRTDALVGRKLVDYSDGTRKVTCDNAACANNVDVATKDGWYIDLPTAGERINVDPKLQVGVLIFASNTPSEPALAECKVGGTSYLNFVDYRTGLAVSSSPDAVAGRSLGDALAVGFNVVKLPDGRLIVIVTKSDASFANAAPPTVSSAPTGKRVSWRELVQ